MATGVVQRRYERTPWFSCEKQPVREGWYEIRLWGGYPHARLWWDCKKGWVYGQDGFASRSFGVVKGDKWRGLAQEWIERKRI